MNKTILVLDDESIIGLLLENFLSTQFEVKHIDNGQEALEWLELNLPDSLCFLQYVFAKYRIHLSNDFFDV